MHIKDMFCPSEEQTPRDGLPMVSFPMASYFASFAGAVRKLCQCTTNHWDSSGLTSCLATPRNGQYCPSEPRALTTPAIEKERHL